MTHIHYLTLRQTRAAAIDMPIGDPNGHGKKQMPVIGIAVGAASLAAGATGMAAVVAGAAIVGGVLSTVGMITKDPDLMKLGGIISVVGSVASIGNLASGALSGAEAAAGGLEAAATDGGLGMPTDIGAAPVEPGSMMAQDLAIDSFQDVGAGLQQDVGLIDSASNTAMDFGTMGEAAKESTQMAMDAKPLESMDQPGTAVETSGDMKDMTGFKTNGVSKTSAFNSDQYTTELNNLTGDTSAYQTLPQQQFKAPTGLINSSQQINELGPIDKFGKWVKDNPELAKMGGEFVKGVAGNLVTSDKDKAVIEAYKQQTADAKRKALWQRGLIG